MDIPPPKGSNRKMDIPPVKGVGKKMEIPPVKEGGKKLEIPRMGGEIEIRERGEDIRLGDRKALKKEGKKKALKRAQKNVEVFKRLHKRYEEGLGMQLKRFVIQYEAFNVRLEKAINRAGDDGEKNMLRLIKNRHDGIIKILTEGNELLKGAFNGIQGVDFRLVKGNLKQMEVFEKVMEDFCGLLNNPEGGGVNMGGFVRKAREMCESFEELPGNSGLGELGKKNLENLKKLGECINLVFDGNLGMTEGELKATIEDSFKGSWKDWFLEGSTVQKVARVVVVVLVGLFVAALVSVFTVAMGMKIMVLVRQVSLGVGVINFVLEKMGAVSDDVWNYDPEKELVEKVSKMLMLFERDLRGG